MKDVLGIGRIRTLFSQRTRSVRVVIVVALLLGLQHAVFYAIRNDQLILSRHARREVRAGPGPRDTSLTPAPRVGAPTQDPPDAAPVQVAPDVTPSPAPREAAITIAPRKMIATGTLGEEEATSAPSVAAPTEAPLEHTPFVCNASKLTPDQLEIQLRAKTVVNTSTRPSVFMHLHPMEEDVHVSGNLIRHGMWERHLWSHVQRELEKHTDALFLDIGSNLGVYSMLAAKMGHDVIAFDPLKRNVQKLCASIADNDLGESIRLYHVALSNRSGEVVGFRKAAENVGGTSVFGRNGSEVSGEYGVDYSKTIRLDELSDLVRGKKLIIKMDIEGSECKAIAGGMQALRSAKEIPMMLTEWFQVASSCEDTRKYLASLASLGLKPYTTAGIPRTGSWESWQDIDMIFKNSPIGATVW